MFIKKERKISDKKDVFSYGYQEKPENIVDLN